MTLSVNLKQLEDEPVSLKGSLDSEALGIEGVDELIRVDHPLEYDFQVSLQSQGLLLQGGLRIRLECECARCLQIFALPIRLDDWSAFVPLEGEEAAPVEKDRVDLTPHIREDILLAFPQTPVCGENCPGYPSSHANHSDRLVRPQEDAGVWSELNKLKKNL